MVAALTSGWWGRRDRPCTATLEQVATRASPSPGCRSSRCSTRNPCTAPPPDLDGLRRAALDAWAHPADGAALLAPDDRAARPLTPVRWAEDWEAPQRQRSDDTLAATGARPRVFLANPARRRSIPPEPPGPQRLRGGRYRGAGQRRVRQP